MRPQEQNIIYDVQGNDIFLYDTEIEASKSQWKMMKKIILFITTESMGIRDYC